MRFNCKFSAISTSPPNCSNKSNQFQNNTIINQSTTNRDNKNISSSSSSFMSKFLSSTSNSNNGIKSGKTNKNINTATPSTRVKHSYDNKNIDKMEETQDLLKGEKRFHNLQRDLNFNSANLDSQYFNQSQKGTSHDTTNVCRQKPIQLQCIDSSKHTNTKRDVILNFPTTTHISRPDGEEYNFHKCYVNRYNYNNHDLKNTSSQRAWVWNGYSEEDEYLRSYIQAPPNRNAQNLPQHTLEVKSSSPELLPTQYCDKVKHQSRPIDYGKIRQGHNNQTGLAQISPDQHIENKNNVVIQLNSIPNPDESSISSVLSSESLATSDSTSYNSNVMDINEMFDSNTAASTGTWFDLEDDRNQHQILQGSRINNIVAPSIG